MKYKRPHGTSRNPGWAFATSPESLVPSTDDELGMGDRMVGITGNVLVSQGPHAGKRFGEIELPYQKAATRYVWGERNDDGTRKVRKVVWVMGKGSSKSWQAAVWALGHAMDLTMRGECSRMVVVVLAAGIQSANVIFEHVKAAIELDPELRPQWQGHSGRRELKHKTSGIVIRCTPPEPASVVGVRACGLFVDEVHEAAKSRDFNAVVDQARRGGSNAGPEFLEVNISTSPIDVAAGYYSKMLTDACRQRDHGGDESLLPLIYTYPLEQRPELDLSDSRQWWRSMPSLGHTQPVAEVEREFSQAATSSDPADMSLFMSQRLCIEPDARKGVGRWVVAERWPSLPACQRWTVPTGVRRPTLGIDIGGSDDLAAMVLIAWVPSSEGGEQLHIWSRQYCTQGAFDRAHPNTRIIYRRAIDAGELFVHTSSSAVEAAIQIDAQALYQRFGDDLWAGGDQYGLAGFGPRFKGGTGLEFRAVKQSFNLLASKNRLESLVTDAAVAHEHLPLMRWNLENLRIDESGQGVKLKKADAGASGQGAAKVDSAFALLSALELAEHPDRTSFDVGTMIF